MKYTEEECYIRNHIRDHQKDWRALQVRTCPELSRRVGLDEGAQPGQLIYQLYGLTEEEIKILEGKT
jgi:hypothetical protein